MVGAPPHAPPIEIGTSSPPALSTWNVVNAPLAWRRGRWNETHGFMGSMREFLFGEFSLRLSPRRAGREGGAQRAFCRNWLQLAATGCNCCNWCDEIRADTQVSPTWGDWVRFAAICCKRVQETTCSKAAPGCPQGFGPPRHLPWRADCKMSKSKGRRGPATCIQYHIYMGLQEEQYIHFPQKGGWNEKYFKKSC
jgi:hypothetical protein